MRFLKLTIASLLAATVAFAGPLTIGTGGPTGNYFSMLNDVTSDNYCGKVFGSTGFTVMNTDGAVDNITGMTEKKYSIGVVQSDVLMSMSNSMPRQININSMKIIAGLHIETIHLLIPNDYAPKNKNNNLFSKFASAFKDNKQPLKLSLLKDQTVASWGGSVVSARALNHFFKLNWDIQTITPDNATDAETPIILVGGQPYAPVEKLLATGKWRLLSIDYNEIREKAPFYEPSMATYKINGSPVTVASIGTQALLMGKAFRDESKNKIMVDFATCIEKSLGDLADDSDTNPNWTSVYENNKDGNLINWAYFGVK